MILIIFRKSQQITEYYKNEMVKRPTNQVALTYAPHYLISQDEDLDFVTKFLTIKFEKSEDKYSEYANLIALGQSLNRKFLLRILNDIEIISILKSKLPETELKRLKSYLIQTFPEDFPAQTYKSTNFFKMVPN
jgi:hypothetical protein